MGADQLALNVPRAAMLKMGLRYCRLPLFRALMIAPGISAIAINVKTEPILRIGITSATACFSRYRSGQVAQSCLVTFGQNRRFDLGLNLIKRKTNGKWLNGSRTLELCSVRADWAIVPKSRNTLTFLHRHDSFWPYLRASQGTRV